jgi:hypothetical protein
MSSSNQKSAGGERTGGANESQFQSEKPVAPPPETALKTPIQTQPASESVNAQPPLPDDSNISQEKSPEESKRESPEESKGESLEESKGESPEESKGESPEESKGESLEESKGESPEEPKGASPEESKGESPEKSSPPREQSPPLSDTVPQEQTAQSPPSPVGSVSTQVTETRSNVGLTPEVLDRSLSVSCHSVDREQQQPVLPNTTLTSQQVTVTTTENPPQQQQQQQQGQDTSSQQLPLSIQTQPEVPTPETAPPAVVTTTVQQPVYTTTTAAAATPTPIAQLHYATVPPAQGGGGIAGGTTPIVKMQGTSDQVVKKKKGRFQLLAQETGAGNTTANNSNAAQPSGGSEQTKAQQQNRNADPAAPGSMPMQSNVNGNRERTSSNHSGVSNNMGNNANTVPQRTFDGTSAPMVKKKGRFVVTNVKDPGSIGVQAQAQSGAGLPPLQNAATSSPMAAQLVMPPLGNHATTDQGQGQQTNTTGSAPPAYQHATMMSVVAAPPGHGMQHPIMYAVAPHTGNSYPQMYTLQPAPPTHMNHHSVENNAPSLGGAHTQQPPPPVSTVASNAEDARTSANIKAKAQKDRKAQSVPRNNSTGEAGLGKVFYFLEQMRLEVAEADRTIKSLQTDAKFLVR